MKNIFNPTVLVTFCLAGTILFSCKKETAVSADARSNSSLSEDASVISETVSGTTTLTLRPGLNDGQDTYVSKIDNDANDGNGNLNYTHELVMSKYYYYGQLATVRSYIKFDSLVKIPSTAKILGAQLQLFGESSSFSFPNGNSYYPGSGNPENTCLVQRVIGGNWNQTTLTWNTMPATTAQYQDTIPPSNSQWNYNTAVNVTKLVAAMVKSGKNYGFCLRMLNEESYRIMEFSTSEVTAPSLRPKLIIRYN